MKLNEKLDQRLNNANGEWLSILPATLGDNDGVVLTDTPGINYVHFENGSVISVTNTAVPAVPNLPVLIGKSKSQRKTWQVIGSRDIYQQPPSGMVKFHHEQHQYPNSDTVWVDRKQLMALTILVYNSASFIVMVGSAVVRTRNGIVLIETETDRSPKKINVSSHIPDYGARFVSIVADDDGLLTPLVGDIFSPPELGTTADIPLPDEGYYMLGYIYLVAGSTQLLEKNVIPIFPLEHNPANISGSYVALTGDQTIAGIKSFTSFPVTPSALPTTDYQVANKKYVDDAASSVLSAALYRQFAYEVDGGVLRFLTDEDGYPLFNLLSLE